MTDSSSGTPTNLTPSTFGIVRIAILMGLLLIGAVGWYLTSSGQVEPTMDEEAGQMLRYVFYIITFTVGVGLFLVHRAVQEAVTFQRRATLSIMAYAMAEGIGLFGVVYMFLTGNATLFLVGLLIFLVAFLSFPVPQEEDTSR